MPVNVLFFDSGVGGLSVLEAVRKLNPGFTYSYVFDNACFPYGELPSEFLVERVTSIVSDLASRLSAGLVVIACNTASTVALPSLRSILDIPVVGVVPALKPAASLTKTGVIGLLATPATVHRSYTQKLIDEFDRGCRIIRVGSSALVREAEKKLSGGMVDMEVMRRELAPFEEEPLTDVIVLGCTHFPHLRTEIESILPGRTLIDSGEAIARRVASLTGNSGTSGHGGTGEVFCTRMEPRLDGIRGVLSDMGLGELRVWEKGAE